MSEGLTRTYSASEPITLVASNPGAPPATHLVGLAEALTGEQYDAARMIMERYLETLWTDLRHP